MIEPLEPLATGAFPSIPPSGALGPLNRFAIKDKSLVTVYIQEGEYMAVADPATTLTTVLGSCVAVCILDPLTGIGGMNHFALPEQKNMKNSGPKERYGEFAMRSLIDELGALGAIKSRLQAKLYGGAKMLLGSSSIGRMNCEFAQSFFQNEGINVVGGNLGGEASRRVRFHPATGRVSLTMAHPRDAKGVHLHPTRFEAPIRG